MQTTRVVVEVATSATDDACIAITISKRIEDDIKNYGINDTFAILDTDGKEIGMLKCVPFCNFLHESEIGEGGDL